MEPKIKALVCAGSYNQYRYWLRENQKNPKEYKYISRREDCLGFRNIPIIYYGTYYERDLDFQLLEAISDGKSSP